MKSETVELNKVAAALEGLRQELGRLGERVAALEAGTKFSARPADLAEDRAAVAVKAPETTPPAAQPVDTSELNEELILIISAAIAAFLGKKPHIRQIRLIGSGAWAQQGRVMIQASHALSVHSPRS